MAGAPAFCAAEILDLMDSFARFKYRAKLKYEFFKMLVIEFYPRFQIQLRRREDSRICAQFETREI